MVHELGHSVGIQHWGHDQWGNIGVNCLPFYASVMNYAGGTGFTTSDLGLSMNPAALVETDSFGEDFDQSVFLGSPWRYWDNSAPIAAGSDFATDWNRDGVLDDEDLTPWRTMSLMAWGSSCNSMATGRVRVVPDEPVKGAMDLFRHGDRLYMIWAVGNALKYKWAMLGAQGRKSCDGSPDPGAVNDPCLSWSATVTLASGGSYWGVSAHSFGDSAYIASQSSTGALSVRRCTPQANGTLTSCTSPPIVATEPKHRSQFTPELVVRHRDPVGPARLGLLYLDQNGKFGSFGRQDATGAWTYEDTLKDPMGVEILGGGEPVAKAWPDEWVPGWMPSEKRTLAILPGPAGEVRVFSLNPGSAGFGRWVNLMVPAVPNTDPYLRLDGAITQGKPFLEYRTRRDTTGKADALGAESTFGGHFMIGWMEPSGAGARARMKLSRFVTKATPPSVGNAPMLMSVSAGDFLRNTWATTLAGSSATLYSDSTLDNVFGAVPIDLPPDVPEGDGINFYPHADGAPDHVFSTKSDYRIMEDYLCLMLSYQRTFDCGGPATPIVTD